MPLYALTIFIGAFLLFLVQPLIGKYILPWFGGSPGVWTTCLLFFQSVLLAGYAYAHYTSTRLRPRTQATVHLVLLLLALVWLPIIPDVDWKPGPADDPARRILLLLTATLGLPYLLLSATGPLLQRWFHLAHPTKSPYRLYSLSNAGSLLALLAYPFAIEPLLSRTTQAWVWSGALALFALLCGACAWQIRRLNPNPPGTPSAAATDESLAAESAAANDTERPTPTQKFFWLALPAVASVLLVATTTKLCTDVAVIPFLWVLPLAIYLLSFILCFDHPRWYSRGVFAAAFVLVCANLCYLLTAGSHAPILRQVTGYSLALFVACMICHGEAYRLRPPPRYLTGFYLSLSLGGALGGLFVAVIAPLLFNDYHEFAIGFWALAYLLAAICLLQRSRPLALGFGAGALLAVVVAPLFVLPAATADAGLLGRVSDYWAAFRGFYSEYRYWAAGVLVVMLWSLRGATGREEPVWQARFAALPLVLTAMLGAIFFMQATSGRENILEASRNFYGTLKVRSYGEPGSVSHNYILSHGVTTHGLQFAKPPYENWVTSYYGAESGVGLAIDLTEPTTGGRNLGLVGLGVGTVSAFGMPGDQLRIYEINPAVLTLARERFTFLSHTVADVKIVMGDARLSMENELAHGAPQNFDVLALDAFSSDAIPVHLLTVEALELYLKHLKPDGIIAVHISNRYLDLRPAIEGLAKHFKLHLATISHDPKDDEWWLYRSTWCLLTRDPARLEIDAIKNVMDEPSDETAKTVVWTDDHASLLPVLK
ncbi:MAG: ferrichrome ABC transporter permease [Opitutus sp.]|nr:ferrichrome ABC transporter permease [Opitutus sp.]